MPYTRPYTGGFKDYPDTTTPINATALNTMDVGIKTANDQFQTVTTAQRTALSPTVGQAVWDSDLKQLMVYMNASGGNAWQPVGNRIVCTSTTRPSTPFHGQAIYETDTKKEYTYNGSAWVQTNSTSTTSGVTGVSNLIVPPACQIVRTTNQTGYTNNSDITFQSAPYDTDGMFSAGSPTKITINTAGLYIISLFGSLNATATLSLITPIAFLNNTYNINYSVCPVFNSPYAYWGMSFVYAFSAGDYVTHRLSISGGSNYSIVGASPTQDVQTRMSVTWLGRTS